MNKGKEVSTANYFYGFFIFEKSDMICKMQSNYLKAFSENVLSERYNCRQSLEHETC